MQELSLYVDACKKTARGQLNCCPDARDVREIAGAEKGREARPEEENEPRLEV